MTPVNFTYWLQGFIELTPEQKQPSPAQWELIKRHLSLVMNPVTQNPYIVTASPAIQFYNDLQDPSGKITC